VPIVKALEAVAVTVIDPPRLTDEPLMVTALLFRAEFGISDKVFVEPDIDVPANVEIVPPRLTAVEPMVIELLSN
jgi:hypothetical protein